MGPWTHGEPEGSRLGDLDFGPDSYKVILEEELRWFDYWLKGIDNGVMDEPPIHIFVMGTNEWRTENEWPLARTQFVNYHLRGGGGVHLHQSPVRPALQMPGWIGGENARRQNLDRDEHTEREFEQTNLSCLK